MRVFNRYPRGTAYRLSSLIKRINLEYTYFVVQLLHLMFPCRHIIGYKLIEHIIKRESFCRAKLQGQDGNILQFNQLVQTIISCAVFLAAIISSLKSLLNLYKTYLKSIYQAQYTEAFFLLTKFCRYTRTNRHSNSVNSQLNLQVSQRLKFLIIDLLGNPCINMYIQKYLVAVCSILLNKHIELILFKIAQYLRTNKKISTYLNLKMQNAILFIDTILRI